MHKYEILAAVFEPTKMHLYDCKTKGKHPVHLIEGGEYITEEELDQNYWESGCDMGWYYINQKEYDYMKSHLEKVYVWYDEKDQEWYCTSNLSDISDDYHYSSDDYPTTTTTTSVVEDITKEELDYFIKMMDDEEKEENK